MSVGKNKNKTLLALFVVLSFFMSFMPMGMRTVYAEELSGEEQQVEQIELQAEVIWTNVPEELPITGSTLKLLNGNDLIEQVEVSLGSSLVTFAPVDKVDSAGVTIPYRIEQDPLEDFETTINDFVVENTYVKPAEAAPEELPAEEAPEDPPVVEEPPVEEPPEAPPVVEKPPVEEPPEDPPVVEEPPVEEPPEAPPVVEEPPVEEPPEAPPVVEEPPVEDPPEAPPVVEEPPVEEPPEAPPVVEEPPVEDPPEAPPVVEEPPVEEPPEAPPVIEEPPEDPPEDPSVEETPVTDSPEAPVEEIPPLEDPTLEMEVIPEDSVILTDENLAVTDISIMAAPDSYEIYSYFPATGTSTNDHYTVEGVFIGTDDHVYLILDNDKATADQFRFYEPILNGVPADGYDLSWQDYESYWDGATTEPFTTSVLLMYPNYDPGDPATYETITGTRMFIFDLGQMTEYLMEDNTLSMQNQADGFSIDGMSFTLDLRHTIDKVVEPMTATIGQEVIYTITVTNTGDYQLSGMDVMDSVPAGITILEVSKDGGATWDPPVYTDGTNSTLILDTDKTLYAGDSLVYSVKAYVNTDAEDGDVLTNTAYTAGSVVTQEDTAAVTVEAVNVTVTKNIIGNLADPDQTFAFTLTIAGGTDSTRYSGEMFNFSLGDDEAYTAYHLPTDGVVTLSEDSLGYDVTVMVGETEISPLDGVYTINLTGADITIDVTNEKNVIIDTGVALDSLPYMLVLALMSAGGVGGLIWKRKHTDFD